MLILPIGKCNCWAKNLRTKKKFFVCGGYQQGQFFTLLLRKVGSRGFKVGDLVSFTKDIVNDLSFGIVLSTHKYTKLFAFVGLSHTDQDSVLKYPRKVRSHRLVTFELLNTLHAFQYMDSLKSKKGK